MHGVVEQLPTRRVRRHRRMGEIGVLGQDAYAPTVIHGECALDEEVVVDTGPRARLERLDVLSIVRLDVGLSTEMELGTTSARGAGTGRKMAGDVEMVTGC
eukprot:CAMPEP_0183382396 /NCGR_PEP_ID=MMETSP0164_2-20130417/126925_1 /TAXON_ID=221442 /ORGANISM="Coccolithus pelagicus ssp braarudi, Strain PLY182g" /LENGTH=100 /DNA_ID=CAMNT_0025560017 /DNA_START=690 /DNA_END=993 /DNA_ORIENTATION=+